MCLATAMLTASLERSAVRVVFLIFSLDGSTIQKIRSLSTESDLILSFKHTIDLSHNWSLTVSNLRPFDTLLKACLVTCPKMTFSKGLCCNETFGKSLWAEGLRTKHRLLSYLAHIRRIPVTNESFYSSTLIKLPYINSFKFYAPTVLSKASSRPFSRSPIP